MCYAHKIISRDLCLSALQISCNEGVEHVLHGLKLNNFCEWLENVNIITCKVI